MIKLEDSSKSYKDFIKLIYVSVTNIFKWFIKYYLDDSLQFSLIYHRAEKTFFHDKCDDEIKVFEVDELKKLDWSTEKIVTSITNLINKNLPERSSSRASIEAFTDRLKVQPETRRMLFDKDKIVGYWQLYPLKENFFEKSVEGNLTSNEITPKSIYTYLIPGRYNIEFGATVLENSYRKTPIFKALLYSIFEYLERLSLEKVFINEVKTETSTDDGASLVESIGLKFYKTHPDGKAKIYRGFLIDLIEKDYLRDFGLLKKLYLQEFK